jgi:hypothetical protein
MYHIGLGALDYYEDGEEWGFTILIKPRGIRRYRRKKDAQKKVDELKEKLQEGLLIEVRNELNESV